MVIHFVKITFFKEFVPIIPIHFSDPLEENTEHVLTMNYMRSCPNLFSKHLFPETVRKPLKDLVSGVCPRTPSGKRISALEFRVSLGHLPLVAEQVSQKLYDFNRRVIRTIAEKFLTWALP